MSTKENKIRAELNQCSGSQVKYFQPLFKNLFYTEGVKEMYILCDAQWLLIDSLSNIKLLKRQYEFTVIKLWKVKKETTCKIEYEDGNGNLIKTVQYPYTTFPLSNQEDGTNTEPALTLWFSNTILYLPSEH